MEFKLRKTIQASKDGLIDAERINFHYSVTPKNCKSNFRSLKVGHDLKIWCTGSDYNSSEIEPFLKTLAKPKEGTNYHNLRAFTFTAEGGVYADNFFDVLFKHIRQNFKAIQTLELNFKEGSHSSLIITANNLAEHLRSSLHTLRNLHIEFPEDFDCNVQDHWINNIGENIKGLQSLHMDIILTRKYAPEEDAISALTAQLRNNLKELETLELHFNFRNLDQWPPFANAINTKKRTLKNISLDFTEYSLKEYNLNIIAAIELIENLKFITIFQNIFLKFERLIFTRNSNDQSALYFNPSPEFDEEEQVRMLKILRSKLTGLQKLHFIYPSTNSKISKQVILEVSDLLKSNCKTLQWLLLNFQSCVQLEDAVVELASVMENKLTDLKEFFLNFEYITAFRGYRNNCADDIPVEQVEPVHKSAIALINGICSNFKSLKAFYVVFPSYMTISNKLGMQEFIAARQVPFGRKPTCNETIVPSISDLTIDLYKKMEPKTLVELFHILIPQLKAVQNLPLDFSLCEKLNSSCIIALLNQIGLNLQGLESISLKFVGCIEITDEPKTSQLNVFQTNSAALRDINLNFSECTNMTDEVVIALSKQFENNFPALQNINLSFSRCQKLTDEAIIALSEQFLNNSPSLENINLNLSKCKEITDDVVIALSKQFQDNLPVLREITLNLSKCEEISDKAIKVLSGCASKLQRLKLVLKYCPLISDESVFSLCGMSFETTETVRQLELLAQNYDEIKKITQNVLAIMSNKIEASFSILGALNPTANNATIVPKESLQELHMEIETDHIAQKTIHQNLTKYDEKGKQLIKELVDKTKYNLTGLKGFHLDLQGCKEITDLSILALRGQIAHFENIERLSLNFDRCRKIKKDFQNEYLTYAHMNCKYLDVFEINFGRFMMKNENYFEEQKIFDYDFSDEDSEKKTNSNSESENENEEESEEKSEKEREEDPEVSEEDSNASSESEY